MEICLWRTFESTLEILYLFTPKLVWKQPQDFVFNHHLTTIINACTLLTSVIKVILSKFDDNEKRETIASIVLLTEIVKRIRIRPLEKINYRVNKLKGDRNKKETLY